MDTASWYDGQYERMWPSEPPAVTAGLDATRHPGFDAYEAAQRKRDASLHTRYQELREQAKTFDPQYQVATHRDAQANELFQGGHDRVTSVVGPGRQNGRGCQAVEGGI